MPSIYIHATRPVFETVGQETLERRKALLTPLVTGLRNHQISYVAWEEMVEQIASNWAIFFPKGGSNADFGDGFSFHFEESWGVGCDLRINTVRCAIDQFLKATLPNGQDVRVTYVVDTKVELSWSSTGRDVETALAAINLYQRATNYGATVRAAMGGNKYLTRWQWAELAVAAAKTTEQVEQEKRERDAERAEFEAKRLADEAKAAAKKAKQLAKKG